MKLKSHTYWLTILAVVIFIGLLGTIHVFQHGTDEEAVRILIRWSAKTSALLFSIAFGISAIQFLFKDKFTRILLKFRPHIGLSFGVSHTFHLAFLIWLQSAIHPVFTLAKTSSLLGGGLAYVFMYAMMVTTFPYFKQKISPARWKMLHLLGGYWIWLIFFRSYFKQVLNVGQGYTLLVILSGVLIIRVCYYIKNLKKFVI